MPNNTDKRAFLDQVFSLWCRLPDHAFGDLLVKSLETVGTTVARLHMQSEANLLAAITACVINNEPKKATPTLGRDEVFYFGCWSKSRTGHFFYDMAGNPKREADSLPPRLCRGLDGVYAGSPSLAYRQYSGGAFEWNRNESQPQNRGRIVHLDGWTVLAFWDRTADERYGCNGAFLAKGTHDFPIMCAVGAAYFPAVWTRLTANEPMLAAAD